MEDEYLKLFSQISKNENPEKKEEPLLSDRMDYSQYENLSKPKYQQYENLNETPDLSRYQINENLNDGWDMNFQFETRINGQVMQSAPTAPAFSRRRQHFNDPNGLNQYMDDDDLNEVYKPQQMKSVNEVVSFKNEDLVGPLNEKFEDVGVVSVEMFNRINSKAFMGLASTVDIKQWKSGI